MELKGREKLKLINTELGPSEEFIIKQREDTQRQLYQNNINHLLTSRDLEIKRSAILNRTNNFPEAEKDFRRTCALYENQKSSFNPQLNQAYQEYVKSYKKMTSLYIFYIFYYPLGPNNNLLYVFDTEKENEKIYDIKEPDPLLGTRASIAQLPNGEIFCFGDLEYWGTTLIIDSDYNARELPSGVLCQYSSAIYFNKNVYCFGGIDKYCSPLSLSSRFDLDESRWVKLTQMPYCDSKCSSAIFKRNILISGRRSSNILIYSIDTDSFSTIPYDFVEKKTKLLINAERLYLIESEGFIYENEAEDEYAWKKIAEPQIANTYLGYCLYNKGAIYMMAEQEFGVAYCKFDLGLKELFKL